MRQETPFPNWEPLDAWFTAFLLRSRASYLQALRNVTRLTSGARLVVVHCYRSRAGRQS